MADGQHLDDVGRGHGVDLAADLEQQSLRDGASQGQGQLEAREGAGLRLDFDLAAHARDRALDDIHAHPAPGQGIGLGARRGHRAVDVLDAGVGILDVAAWPVSVILIPMKPRETLEAFDAFLAERGLRLDAVVVGGAALNLLGVVSRPTKDCDILYPQLPDEIGNAAKAFAAARRQAGVDLGDCLALAPTREELAGLLPWLDLQDGNPGWPAHVHATLADLGQRLGHGF